MRAPLIADEPESERRDPDYGAPEAPIVALIAIVALLATAAIKYFGPPLEAAPPAPPGITLPCTAPGEGEVLVAVVYPAPAAPACNYYRGKTR